MKVLYLVPQPNRAGQLAAYSFLDEEIFGMAAAGVEPYVLSTTADRDFEDGPVKVRAVPPVASPADHAKNLGFLWRCRSAIPFANVTQLREFYRPIKVERFAADVIEAEGVDLIHSHFGWPAGFGGVLARTATARPLVASLRGTDILVDPGIAYGRRNDPHYDRTIRRLLAGADRTVYFSEFMRERGVSYGARPDRARVVEKGVDLSRFKPAADRRSVKRDLGLPDRPMILTVAGLVVRKGIHHALDALAGLRDTHDFSFVVCGEGPERERLERQSEALGLRDRTYFMGKVDRRTIPAYFAACEVFVLASIVEAAGNVLFEAMASARPVVCTASGGPAEYVEDGRTGFLVPVGDARALAGRIRTLLDDAALQDRLGQEGRRRTLVRFDYQRMTRDILRVYDEVLSAGNGRQRPAGR
jgi:glycosyltransferase involved in cell wall biosynthesis